MSKKITPLAAAFALAALSLPSFAANGTSAARSATPAHPAKSATTLAATTAKAQTGKAIGEITSVDATAASLVVKTKSGSDTFSVPSSAKITSHGKSIAIGDLKAGEKVEVTYNTQGATMTATYVTLLGHA